MEEQLKETMCKDIYSDKLGNIYSNKTGKIRLLKPQKVFNTRSKRQYWSVTRYGLVHRLVASAFIGNVNGYVINHIDGNPSNNAVYNLEIVTQKENHRHALLTGLIPVGENHSRAKYSDETLFSALKEITAGCSVVKTATKFGISQSYLNKVKNKVYRVDLWDKINNKPND